MYACLTPPTFLLLERYIHNQQPIPPKHYIFLQDNNKSYQYNNIMKLNFSSLSLLFFFCFFFSDHLITAHDLVHQTCKKCAQNDPNLNYNFCVTSLEAVPSSHCADLRQLGMISINLTRRNVTNTRSYINELLKNKKSDPFMSSCLTDCYELYSDAISTLQQAIKDYKSKQYEDANFEISSVMDASTTCEDGFKEQKGLVSPLTKRNNNSFQLSVIALSIINMLD
ncbi:putative invertase inhibitor [Pistacia vera]|uniref:putative invertase inhibitor n=1 Tax=Pistacia vera TaxID=55513 RepID=UPI0012631D15|nr:putative invertase inhibitor [Pistacia vera]